MTDLFPVLMAETGVLLISFLRGAFGGGFAAIGIPLLSLAMDPLTAGAVLAPLFVAMDLAALRYWRPHTWSKPDLLMLVPGLVVGIAVGTLALKSLDARAAAILIGAITLGFAGLYFVRGGRIEIRPRSKARALVAGTASGITTMVAHAGGPPLAMYLLPLGLPKQIYAGTTSLFFTVANGIKVWPWLLVQPISRDLWTLWLLCVPAVPLGIWLGWRVHARLDPARLYRFCYGLLAATALMLLWDGLSGYLR